MALGVGPLEILMISGDYPVYIIQDQLCRASDECEPPTRYKVSLMAEKHRVIQVDIDCGDWPTDLNEMFG